MYCTRCGAAIAEGQRFCPSCGTPAGPVAPAPAQSRVAGHIRLVGILWIVLSLLRLFPGLFLLAMFGHSMEYMPPDVPVFVHGIMQLVGAALVCGGLLGIAAGWGLLARQGWARMLAIVLGFLSLLEVPFGTALGIYTLWVLMPASSDAEYRAWARPA